MAASVAHVPGFQITRLVVRFGEALRQGWEQGAPRDVQLKDEPLPPETEPDYQFAFDVAIRRREHEAQRSDQIDTKIAPIIAGTIAALALFLNKATTSWDILAGALFLIPLVLLLLAFRASDYRDAPKISELVRTWVKYPRTFQKVTVEALAGILEDNARAIDRKARTLNNAIIVLFAVTVVVLGIRFTEAAYHVGKPTPVTTAAPRAATTAIP